MSIQDEHSKWQHRRLRLMLHFKPYPQTVESSPSLVSTWAPTVPINVTESDSLPDFTLDAAFQASLPADGRVQSFSEL